MRLIYSPESKLFSQIKQLQKRLNYEKWRPDHEKEMTILTRFLEFIKNTDDFDYKNVPEFMKASFSFPINPEAKIEQIIKLSTNVGSFLSMYDLLKTWDEISVHIVKASPIFDHGNTEFILATAAHQSTNARVFIPDKSSVNIIMFYNRLFYFISDLSWLLPSAINGGKTTQQFTNHFEQIAIKQIEKDTRNNTLLESYMMEIFSRYFIKNKPITRLVKSSVFTEDSRIIAMDIEDSIRYFIICHEIAHIFCNHSAIAVQKIKLNPKNEGSYFSEIERKWYEELEADHVGFQLGLIAAKGNLISNQVYIWAVAIFFSVNSLIEDYRSRHNPTTKPSSKKQPHTPTHPPMRDRWVHMKKVILQISADSQKAYDLTVPETVEQKFQFWIAQHGSKFANL